MKSFLYFLLPFFVSQSSISQRAEWERVYVKDVGYFEMPPTMEVQSGLYKVFIDDLKETMGYNTNHVVVQQKGLNELERDGFQKYGRVILETQIGKAGDFEKLDFDINQYLATEATTNISFKQNVIQSFVGTGLKLVEWFPAHYEKVNDYSTIHVKYRRQLKDQPVVLVNMYLFGNYNRQHTLTLSYRENEASFWELDFQRVLKSFRVTNKM